MWNYLLPCFMLSSLLHGQNFSYKIKLQNVNTLPEAKYATDPLRDLFKTYPIFNDSLDMFDFTSSEFSNEADLIIYMNSKNYTVIFFSYEALKPKERGGNK